MGKYSNTFGSAVLLNAEDQARATGRWFAVKWVIGAGLPAPRSPAFSVPAKPLDATVVLLERREFKKGLASLFVLAGRSGRFVFARDKSQTPYPSAENDRSRSAPCRRDLGLFTYIGKIVNNKTGMIIGGDLRGGVDWR